MTITRLCIRLSSLLLSASALAAPCSVAGSAKVSPQQGRVTVVQLNGCQGSVTLPLTGMTKPPTLVRSMTVAYTALTLTATSISFTTASAQNGLLLIVKNPVE